MTISILSALTRVGAAMMVIVAATDAHAQTIAPPVTGTPAQPWWNTTLSPDQRADLVVKAMTQDEKFAWISAPMPLAFKGGKIPAGAIGSAAFYPAFPRLGIPAQQQSDAGLGVSNAAYLRHGDNATALPSSLLLGAGFDPATARETGALIGQEARAKGFNVLLAAGANLIREPRGGRNFEYVSEDPLLTGLIAGNSISGVQSQGIVSTVKHFAVNAQETGRVVVSSDLSKSALHEADLLAFEISIEIGKPGAVMPGYNLVNGDWATENSYLINTVLKGQWRYPGWVMSDWGATHSTEKAALAGLDVQSGSNLDPQPFFVAPLRAAVAAGRVPQSRIDDMVRRQLRSLFASGAFDNPARPGGAIDYMAHRLVAQRAAERGLVLLKNDGNILPLAKGARRLLVVGNHADVGVLAGGGSSIVAPVGSLNMMVDGYGPRPQRQIHHPSSPLLAIEAEGNAAEVQYLDGRNVAATIAAARTADAVIVFGEQWRGEGRDTQGLGLPDGQEALISAVAAANAHTVVVLESGGAVTMPWIDHVPAVLAAFYPGSGGAEAIAGVLFGRVNPSGHLPITFPVSDAELPRPVMHDPTTTTSNPAEPVVGQVFHVDYNIEGSDVGYRWYARQGLKPLFPFGYGLSYTSFQFDKLAIRKAGSALIVSAEVRNVGNRSGADVPQFYVSLPGKGGFVSRLVGFQRINLEPGESGKVEATIDPRLLARYDSSKDRWQIAKGHYDLRVGHNAEDGGVHVTFNLEPQTLAP